MQIRYFRATPRPVWHFLATAGAAGVLASGVAACGAKDASPTQAAARVNKEEITVHQIGALLSQQTVKPDQVREAERQILERLINRELSVQKAAELKLDREPRVVQAIESARKDVIARAYADKLSEGATRPSSADIKKYYDEHPALFRERKVFQLQEFYLQADPAQVQALKTTLASSKGSFDLAGYLKSSDIKFTTNALVRAAEQVPLSLLPTLSRLTDGQALLNTTPAGAQVIVVKAVRSQPVDEERATRAIEQFLLNEQKRKLLDDDVKALRAAAKIEYQGRFAASAPAPADSAPPATAADVAASAAAGLEPVKPVNAVADPSAASASPSDAAASSAGGIDASTVNKGLGLK
jgi:EpsD family peptidyl-prolyl cis-trans isomerase